MSLLASLETLSRFPAENVWMLAVDGKLYGEEDGPSRFEEREKGSVEAILKGLQLSLTYLGKELSVEEVLAIHKACMQGVTSRNPCVPGEYRTTNVAFSVPASWCSAEGLLHLLQNKSGSANLIPTKYALVQEQIVPIASIQDKKNMKIAASPTDALDISSTDKEKLQALHAELVQENISLLYQPPQAESTDFKMELEAIAKNYNMRIKQGEDDILLLIAATIQACTRLHPFRDGNNRSFVNCLLNRLLIENGLAPALFFEPNVFEFHTPYELVTIIAQAQNQSRAIINEPDAPVYGYDNNKTAKQFTTMGNEFKIQLSLTINQIARQNFQRGDYDLASAFFSLSYQLELQINKESTNTAITLFSLASCMKKLGELQEAKQYFSSALGIFAKTGRKDLETKARENIKELDRLLAPKNTHEPS